MAEETKEVKKMCQMARRSILCLIGIPFSMIISILLNNFLGDVIYVFTFIIIPALLVLSVIFAVISLKRIRRSEGLLKGKRYAVACIVLSFVIATFVFLPSPHTNQKLAYQIVCGTNFKGLGTMIAIYASDHGGAVSGGSNWCDILIMEVDGDPGIFKCKGSGAVYGESSYAINKNALGKKLSELPADMVLVFETSLGRKDIERTDEVRNRPSFNKYPETSKIFSGKEKVYLNRWNQVGGAEDLTVDNHEGRGCNVLFGDGTVDWIKAEDIGKLRWTVE